MAMPFGMTGNGPADPFKPQRRTSPPSAGRRTSDELSIRVVTCNGVDRPEANRFHVNSARWVNTEATAREHSSALRMRVLRHLPDCPSADVTYVRPGISRLRSVCETGMGTGIDPLDLRVHSVGTFLPGSRAVRHLTFPAATGKTGVRGAQCSPGQAPGRRWHRCVATRDVPVG